MSYTPTTELGNCYDEMFPGGPWKKNAKNCKLILQTELKTESGEWKKQYVEIKNKWDTYQNYDGHLIKQHIRPRVHHETHSRNPYYQDTLVHRLPIGNAIHDKYNKFHCHNDVCHSHPYPGLHNHVSPHDIRDVHIMYPTQQYLHVPYPILEAERHRMGWDDFHYHRRRRHWKNKRNRRKHRKKNE